LLDHTLETIVNGVENEFYRIVKETGFDGLTRRIKGDVDGR